MAETMRSSTEVGKRTRLGADYLLYLLAEKNLYENQEVIWKNSLADLIR